MPVTKSAKKEMWKSKRRQIINDEFKENMKIAMKIFFKKVSKWEKLKQKDINDVYKKIDKAYKRNIIHRNNAARKKSKIAKAFATVSVVKKITTKTSKTKK